MQIIPTTVVDAFAKGDILQVLLFAILFGVALALLGERGRTGEHVIEETVDVLFKMMGFIVRLAPLGVLGAIAFTVGKYGVGSLGQLGMLVALFYAIGRDLRAGRARRGDCGSPGSASSSSCAISARSC